MRVRVNGLVCLHFPQRSVTHKLNPCRHTTLSIRKPFEIASSRWWCNFCQIFVMTREVFACVSVSLSLALSLSLSVGMYVLYVCNFSQGYVMTREDNEDAKFLDAADMEQMKTTRCRLFAVGTACSVRARSLSFTHAHTRVLEGGRSSTPSETPLGQ